MTAIAATSQKITQAQAGALYEVDYIDPHGQTGLVKKDDQSERPEVFFVLPGTGVILSEIPLHKQAEWNVHNTVFATAGTKGFVLDGCGQVLFEELEVGILVQVCGPAASRP